MSDYKYIDMDRVNRRIAEGDVSETDENEPVTDVLFGTIWDLLKIAENEGMTEEEVDEVLRRLNDRRAEEKRNKFRLHIRE